eukprot:TRINITY_DN8296_c1_g1_i1.p1 TRINITY_DN8296_c1_g1~~TRINITY_DN8296_c1_g1_i1.p1  ORF type:complete len:1087 (-),score=248.94 TRINITY_DN8296_c1_g1_i1:268-3528(-)
MSSVCTVCRQEPVDPDAAKRSHGVMVNPCDRCQQILKAPPCLACGEPVRDARKNDPEPYHAHCRRCNSCGIVVKRENMHRVAGKILCTSCEGLFGEFFVPGRRGGADYMEEAFKAWDVDKNGSIEKDELARVLQALMPNFSDRDMTELMRIVDKNGNGVIEYAEFCEWITKENPFEMDKGVSFADIVAQLMREAGQVEFKVGSNVTELQVRTDGVYFIKQNGQTHRETTAFRCDSLELTALDPEAFIKKIESTEAGLVVGMNTGRTVTLPGKGQLFGPYNAPEGFHIGGLKIKPLEKPDANGAKDFVHGVDLCPLPQAARYDEPQAMVFAAEQEYLSSLREILSKACLDVNAFGASGATALMLAAAAGATGSMRLLMSCKANPNIADSDGWTALTYASRCGSTSAVEALMKKGASETGDGGAALSQALRNKHNSAARSLLRAGFGPAPIGSFSLEAFPQEKDCKLKLPKVLPNGGAFARPTEVSLSSEDDGVQLLYTLDGRDPFEVGERYKGPFMVYAPRSQLRVVAVQGKHRSMCVEASFVVCHFAMPDEVVSGAVKANIFPGAIQLMKNSLASLLDMPPDRLQLSSDSEESGKAKGPRWIQVKLIDTKPRHQIRLDQAFATVKTADKRKKFLAKFAKDVQKGVGEEPEDCEVLAGDKVILVNFELSRAKAEEFRNQLMDDTSYLLTKAVNRRKFKTAKLNAIDALGAKLVDKDFQEELNKAVGTATRKKSTKTVAFGHGDEGYLGIPASSHKAAGNMMRPLDSVIKKNAILKDVEEVEIQEFPEEMELEYNLDVIEVGAATDIIKAINADGVPAILDESLAAQGLEAAELSVVNAATSRKLAQVQLRLEWNKAPGSKTDAGAIQDGLDASCYAYAEEDLVHIVDFKQAIEDPNVAFATKDVHFQKLARVVNQSVRLDLEPGAQMQKIRLDLAALPPEVTDLYFVLSAFEADTLGTFCDLKASLIDESREKALTTMPSQKVEAQKTKEKALALCNLSRYSTGWVLHRLDQTCGDGHVKNVEPILKFLNDKQSVHLNWERRQTLVLLRTLHKTGRMSASSTSDFAQLLNQVMNLPLGIFQLFMKYV